MSELSKTRLDYQALMYGIENAVELDDSETVWSLAMYYLACNVDINSAEVQYGNSDDRVVLFRRLRLLKRYEALHFVLGNLYEPLTEFAEACSEAAFKAAEDNKFARRGIELKKYYSLMGNFWCMVAEEARVRHKDVKARRVV